MAREIQLTNQYVAIVDDEDYPIVAQYKWWAVRGRSRRWSMYVEGWIRDSNKHGRDKQVKLHRFLMGVNDPAVKVDHKNGNGLDNRKENLRLADAVGNSRNRQYVPNKSGYKGVTTLSPMCHAAYIRVNRKRLHIGCYKTAEEAARAYDNAARRYHGEFACLNFYRGRLRRERVQESGGRDLR